MRRDEGGIQRSTDICPGGAAEVRCRSMADSSAERVRQQARAKHHETSRRYRQESARHQVIVVHETPASLDARTNSLNTSEPALFERGEACLSSDQGVRAIAFDGVGKENAGAH